MNLLQKNIKELNMYMREIAHYCNVSVATLTRQIKSSDSLSIRVTVKLANLLEIPPENVLQLADTNCNITVTPEPIVDPAPEVTSFIQSHVIEGRPTKDVYEEFDSLHPGKFNNVWVSRYICKRGGFCVKVKRDGNITRRYYAVKG